MPLLVAITLGSQYYTLGLMVNTHQHERRFLLVLLASDFRTYTHMLRHTLAHRETPSSRALAQHTHSHGERAYVCVRDVVIIATCAHANRAHRTPTDASSSADRLTPAVL